SRCTPRARSKPRRCRSSGSTTGLGPLAARAGSPASTNTPSDVSSANRERRQRNQAARTAAVEEAMRRARRQRITFSIVGLALALVVGIALVARATSGNGSSAASTTTTTLAPTSTTVPAPKRCVAVQKPLPTNTPLVPVVVGKPPTKLVTRDLTVGT